MKIIETKKKLCLCCMEIHDVKVVDVEQTTTFKGIPVKHVARYEYCDLADEYSSNEDMMTSNDIAMKDAYRKENHLLTSKEIAAIRRKYDISQKDLASILGWGEKTITRYEGHQVQDTAHDFVLRKIDEEPLCLFEFLRKRKDSISTELYGRYAQAIKVQSEKTKDQYLRKSIQAEYLKYQNQPELQGNTSLNFDKVVDVICYFANAEQVQHLYKVKLMKLLWYADFLSFKRRNRGITGLVYQTLPMGAVPVAHKSIVELDGVHYEEVEFDQGVGMKFQSGDDSYKSLNEEELQILEEVAALFGHMTKKEIVDKMHAEKAYLETKEGQEICYVHAKWLNM